MSQHKDAAHICVKKSASMTCHTCMSEAECINDMLHMQVLHK